METSIAHGIDITGKKAVYDTNVKRLLAEKIILAHILLGTVPEFEGMEPKEIVALIEGEPEVEEISAYPGETNMSVVTGLRNEDAVPNEGKIIFDILFSVRVPKDNQLIKMIVDVEAQKGYYPGYDLVTRGLFYAARMLSAQMDREFTAENYGDIKKVYSIWICMDCPDYAKNTITRYGITQENVLGNFPKDKTRYDLLETIMVCLSEDIASGDGLRLHRLLGILFSSELKVSEKKSILEEEYNIPMTKNMERMAVEMCNLSDLIEERGIRRGIQQGIQQGEQQGMEIMAQLSVRLAEDGRITEISRAASDRKYLEQLLKEYGIQITEKDII